MRHRNILTTIFSFIAVFCLGFVISESVFTGKSVASKTVQAAPNPLPDSHRCSTRTLGGAYGIKFEGRKVTGEPIVSVSRISFDGDGRFTTHEIGRLNGVEFERTFTGPYVVNDDCTGYLDFSSILTNPPHEVHGDFVIVDEGKEFFVLDNEENWAASGVGKKL